MPKINCGVQSCSYNQNNDCNAGIIQVGGKGAQACEQTCCGTYLNSASYSNLAQYTCNRGDVKEILCRVDTCVHYQNEQCKLERINVGCLEGVDVYTETECQSFESK